MKKGQIALLVVAILIIIIVALNWKKWFGKGGKGTSGTNGGVQAQAIADRLYELMNGLTLYPSSRKEVEETLTQVANSSNADFAAVWNAFGNRDGNLAEWAKDEYYVDNSISDLISNRAAQLSLK